jgi:GH18 family chitinase
MNLITKITTLLTIFLLLPSLTFSKSKSKKQTKDYQPKKIGYLMSWRDIPSDKRIAAYTHVIMTGYKLDATKLDGSLDTSFHTSNHKIKTLTAKAKKQGVKVMIMLGGWGSHAGFPEAAADPKKSLKLANDLIAYCKAYGIAGVDYDWEFPTKEQFKDYDSMMKITRKEFDKYGLLLTSAIGQSHIKDFTEDTYKYMDWINVMSYDMHWVRPKQTMPGNHSPRDVNKPNIQGWLDRGVPREKIVMGMPFYVRGTNDWGDAVSYFTIYEKFKPSDDHNIAGGYNFNGYNTIYNKSIYNIEQKIGGVMVWEIEHDLPATHPKALMHAMNEGVKDGLAGKFIYRPVTKDVDLP